MLFAFVSTHSIQQQLDLIASQRQKELLAKRSKTEQSTTEIRSAGSHGAAAATTSAAAEYLKQKSELENMAGCSSDDAGKWLVR